MQNPDSAQNRVDAVGLKIKSIKKLDHTEDVYCLATLGNGNFVANGIIVKNCDVLRYILYTHKVPKYTQESIEQEQEIRKSNFHPGGSKWNP